MDYKDAVIREDAMEYLIRHYAEFPADVPVGPSKNVSDRMFINWRWVRCLDGEIVFANCIQEGITANDFNARKETMRIGA
ncbi:hypothetical protein C7387_4339 [Yokenella regensburgei]|uniref:Uncharacterized protein n=1 Tax=Yokenella regensburgei TaxID=158877 RepID=A0ABX9RT85_9ENTR|nr:hypothetical protein [Yokenella regensburgei]RKR53198.1 hypothetical protein C7387_4339 [Yokenella regensburgei]VFS16093.1 Uncharacterised protein [Yokenella regensburgei]